MTSFACLIAASGDIFACFFGDGVLLEDECLLDDLFLPALRLIEKGVPSVSLPLWKTFSSEKLLFNQSFSFSFSLACCPGLLSLSLPSLPTKIIPWLEGLTSAG